MKLIIQLSDGVQYGALIAGLASSASRKGIMETVKLGDHGTVRDAYERGDILASWWVEESVQEVPPTSTTSPNPLDYQCPVCGSHVGKYCTVAPSRRGEYRREVPWVHPAREELAQTQNGESNA